MALVTPKSHILLFTCHHNESSSWVPTKLCHCIKTVLFLQAKQNLTVLSWAFYGNILREDRMMPKISMSGLIWSWQHGLPNIHQYNTLLSAILVVHSIGWYMQSMWLFALLQKMALIQRSGSSIAKVEGNANFRSILDLHDWILDLASNGTECQMTIPNWWVKRVLCHVVVWGVSSVWMVWELELNTSRKSLYSLSCGTNLKTE